MNTIVDTDALIGLFDITDAHNKEAQRILEELTRRGINTFILPTTIAEFAAASTGNVGMTKAQEATKKILYSGMTIIEADEDLTVQAVAIYLKQGSRKETLFDCFVMAAAKKLGITHIFSFDKGYKKQKNGFLLISDLL
jgi:predicted nucleic acid-binding protein